MTLVKRQEYGRARVPILTSRQRVFKGTIANHLGVEREANTANPGDRILMMRSLLQPAFAAIWLTLAVTPALAQLDRIGGAVEFRVPDRPIPAPTFGAFDDTKSSDLNKLLSTGVPTDALKGIDRELGRTSTGLPVEADVGRRESTAKVGDRPNQRALEGSTFR